MQFTSWYAMMNGDHVVWFLSAAILLGGLLFLQWPKVQQDLHHQGKTSPAPEKKPDEPLA